MNQFLKENNYVVINNFLLPNQAKELYLTYVNDIKFNNIGNLDEQCPNNAKSVFNYRWFSELHINKLYQLSEFMGESLFPTYQYSRLYQKGSFLKKHIDRPACEISVTVHLGSDGTSWPLYFTKPNGNVASVNLKPGEAVVYLGIDSVHWRDEYKGNDYAQVFLHYVRARGNYWDEMFDLKRIRSEKNA
jgi:hypothetical protein